MELAKEEIGRLNEEKEAELKKVLSAYQFLDTEAFRAYVVIRVRLYILITRYARKASLCQKSVCFFASAFFIVLKFYSPIFVSGF